MCSTVFTVATKCHTQITGISLSNYLCMKRVYMYNHAQIYFFHFSIWKKAFYVLLLDVMVNMFISKHETYFFKDFFLSLFSYFKYMYGYIFWVQSFFYCNIDKCKLIQNWVLFISQLWKILFCRCRSIAWKWIIYSPNNIWNAHCW